MRRNNDKVNQAAQRMAEIVTEQMSTLQPEKAKALREEIRKLAGKKSGSPSTPLRTSKAAALQKTK